jgi:hypothetical protein
MSLEGKITERRPNLSVLALISFACSFAVVRLFTTVSPDVSFHPFGFHIHHFWYGIFMLAVGGWLGISYNDPRIDRIAAIIFGAGGGLIGDEIGILVTLRSDNYWAGISYTSIIIILAIASILVLFNKYHKTILEELGYFSGSRGGFYLAVFVEAVSIAFLIDTNNTFVIIAATLVAAIAFLIIVSFFVQTIRMRLRQGLRPKQRDA